MPLGYLMTLDEVWTANKGKHVLVRNVDDNTLYVITTKTPQGEFVGYNQNTGRGVVLATNAPDWELFGIIKPTVNPT